MLDDCFASVLAVKDAADFRAHVLRFAKWLGFDLAGAFVAVDRTAGGVDFHGVDNMPAAYQAAFESTDNRQCDPVMQHCKRHGAPIMWDQETYLRCDLGAKWEEQAAFGLRAGIGVALHLPRGLHFMVGVARDRSLSTAAAERCKLAGDLCLFAAFAQEAAMKVLVPCGDRASDATSLSMRELEVLRWTADGKTAWEVGRILGISEQTVTRHVMNGAQKLGCVNKVQAVAKAVRLGLVH